MDSNEILEKIGRLKDTESMKDIKQLTAALFPGTHCPLMGAAMAVRGIKDAAILVVGTNECAYYTKHMTLHSDEFGGIDGRCLSVVLTPQDVTFGCGKSLETAFREVMQEYNPQAVYIVTTCVVELIGDDMDAMTCELEEQYHIPVMAVHTEHFKCDNHLPGLEHTMTASLNMMEKCPCDGSVNLLGQRMGRFEDTELCEILKNVGVKIGLQLPGGCTVEEIRRGPAAKVNIVVDNTALPLAKKMEKKFQVPYVIFERYADPDITREVYIKLFDHLKLPYAQELERLYQAAAACIETGKKELAGITYVYGNTPLHCFELNKFMAELGMVPMIIQVSGLEDSDKVYIKDILDKENPYVTKSANIAPLQHVYDVLKPHLYLGHEYAERLRKKGIAIVRTDSAGSKLGFEITGYVVKELMRAAHDSIQWKAEIGTDKRKMENPDYTGEERVR